MHYSQEQGPKPVPHLFKLKQAEQGYKGPTLLMKNF